MLRWTKRNDDDTYQLHIGATKDERRSALASSASSVSLLAVTFTPAVPNGILKHESCHLVKNKKLYWYIDYLLADPDVTVYAVRLIYRPKSAH